MFRTGTTDLLFSYNQRVYSLVCATFNGADKVVQIGLKIPECVAHQAHSEIGSVLVGKGGRMHDVGK